MNEFMTATLREYVLQHPELHKMMLTDDEIKAMETLTLRRCFYSCSNCRCLLLREDELFSFEGAMRRTAEVFFEHVEFLIEAFEHKCPAVAPVAPPARQKPICDLRSIAEQRSGKLIRRGRELLIVRQGHRFGKLTAVRLAHGFKGEPRWVVKCDCGQQQSYSASWLLNGRVRACKECKEIRAAG